jgi:hypothetical protein
VCNQCTRYSIDSGFYFILLFKLFVFFVLTQFNHQFLIQKGGFTRPICTTNGSNLLHYLVRIIPKYELHSLIPLCFHVLTKRKKKNKKKTRRKSIVFKHSGTSLQSVSSKNMQSQFFKRNTTPSSRCIWKSCCFDLVFGFQQIF